MPFEYILMLFLALCPPVFFYVMDPRVKSIRDAQAGIANPDAWSGEHPLSKSDRQRQDIAVMYFIAVSLVLTGFLFFES